MSDTAQHNDNNGRITLAILGERMDVVIRQQAELMHQFRLHQEASARRDERISLLEQALHTICDRLGDVDKDVNNLKSRDWLAGGIATALATIAGIIAAVLGLKSP